MTLISGKVIQGKKRGKELGYPTANIILQEEIPQGIYISETLFDSKNYPSVTFIGNAVTFGEEEVFAETYILNFNQDIYNMEITVQLIKKIRENEKFDSVEELVKQIKEDVRLTQEYFELNTNSS